MRPGAPGSIYPGALWNWYVEAVKPPSSEEDFTPLSEEDIKIDSL